MVMAVFLIFTCFARIFRLNIKSRVCSEFFIIIIITQKQWRLADTQDIFWEQSEKSN